MAQFRRIFLALAGVVLVAGPSHAASATVTLTVPVRCDISLIGSDIEKIEQGASTEIGSIHGSCNVPHSIALTTPEWQDYRGEFVYEGNSEPFAMGRTTFRKLEGARIYSTPLLIAGHALDEARAAYLMSRLTIMPAL